MKIKPNSSERFLLVSTGLGVASILLTAATAQAQTPPGLLDEIRKAAGNRVEAFTVLGGDYGASGGEYTAENDQHKAELTISKFGGGGDLGDPKPLFNLPIAWQPRFQGNVGYLTAENKIKTGDFAHDKNEFDTFAIEFGAGARFWFDEHFSIAPTISGMYGHTEEDYTARSTAGQAIKPAAKAAGVVDWNIDTWSVIPAANIQYQWTWRRTIITLSSDLAYYHTESFSGSEDAFKINGDSESWKNKIDVDMPLGISLFNRELRTGGFFSRTEFFDNLQKGLNTDHMYEFHGRFVADVLNHLWKVQWIGLGGSYFWGSNFDGFSIGIDLAFRF